MKRNKKKNDFFKAAFSIFGGSIQNSSLSSSNGANSSVNHHNHHHNHNNHHHQSPKPSNSSSNEFVGQCIIINNMKLKITKVLAEGGFAIVYAAEDIIFDTEFALKRIFSHDPTTSQAILKEIMLLKKVTDNPNIINFVASGAENLELQSLSSAGGGSQEFLILTELCKEPLIDHLRAGLLTASGAAFNFEQVLSVFYQICKAVQHLHRQEPPVIHRDLKLENFLISQDYRIKLCDFGSATCEVFHPDNSWSVNKRNLLEEELAKQTTPMYRAPEMLDLYNNYRIDVQVDIWSLGCVLFLLCYNKHPYEDAAKLRIINAKYQLPNTDKDFVEFHDLFRTMFNTDPSLRPSINEVMSEVESIARKNALKFMENLTFLKKTELILHNGLNSSQASNK
jgi:cyclin G-associated kinase